LISVVDTFSEAVSGPVVAVTPDANGHFRLAANLRQVQDSLDRIIPALEALADSRDTDDG
jgi:hypothetical protein